MTFQAGLALGTGGRSLLIPGSVFPDLRMKHGSAAVTAIVFTAKPDGFIFAGPRRIKSFLTD
jgi:hypothetical protein